MGTVDAATPAASMRLLLARAAALGIEHASLHPAAFDDTAVLATLWPEHDSTCECEDCEEVIEAYEVAWLEETQVLAEEEETA